MLLTIKEAAAHLNVSYGTVRKLVNEGLENPKKSRWKEGREFIDFSVLNAKKRVIRIRPEAVGIVQNSEQ